MKALASSLLAGVRVPAFFRRRNRRRLPILMYHGIVERRLSPDCWHQLEVAEFRRQIEWVAGRYHVLPLEDALEQMYAGTLPERSLAITFDDGYRNNLELALPILEEFRTPATVFVVTDLVGTDAVPWPDRLYLAFAQTRVPIVTSAPLALVGARLLTDDDRASAYVKAVQAAKALPRGERDAAVAALMMELQQAATPDPGPFRMLSWDDVKALTNSGLVTVASHTRTHPILSRCSDDDVRAEVGPAHEALTLKVGRAPRVVAYPVGRRIDYDARSIAAVAESQIPFALTTVEGLAGIESAPRELPRLSIGHDLAFSRFQLLVSGALTALRGPR